MSTSQKQIALRNGNWFSLASIRRTLSNNLYISATDTALIAWESGVFDLEIQYAAGPDEVDRLIYGSVVVSREVTRA